MNFDQVLGEASKTVIKPDQLGRSGGGGKESSLIAPRLYTKGLIKVYKKRKVVNEVDLEVGKGEVVGLLGPNGAGKTTTFYMIVGLIRPEAGEIFITGRNITGLPMYRRANLGIGYLPQEPSVFRKLTVEENLLAILEARKFGRKERRRRCEELLEELGLAGLRSRKAYSLSGGERRRLEITRALISDPLFILLDEPFAGVDPIAVDDIQGIISRLRQRGIGILITDHNVRETLQITDRAYIMFEGRIHLSGDADTLINDPTAKKLYLGQDFRM